MDGIRKKLEEKNDRNIITPPRKAPLPPFPKKEVLYISKEETMFNGHEKKFQNGRRIRKIILISFSALAITFICFLMFILWKTYVTTKKMNVSSQQTTLSQDMKSMIAPILPLSSNYALKGEDSGRINILLLGAAGENKPGGNLTDTIMIMSIDMKNQKVALLSLPRDFYAPIGESNSFTKINSLYKIGLSQQSDTELIKKAIEKITGLSMNYYMVLDFDGFRKIIDDINGVNIMVERDIYDPTYPGPNYSYELFAIKKGAHLLNGDTALKYVRERHDDPEGDFGRAKRQQQVIQAVKSRLFSMQTLFNVVALSNVLDTLGDNIKTDMSFQDIEKMIKLSKTVDTQNITNVVIDAWKSDSLLKVSHVMVGNMQAFILIPRVGNYSEIKDVAQNIFDQAELKKRQAFIANENATIEIINRSTDQQITNKIKKLLTEKLGIKKVHIISTVDSTINENTTVSSNSAIEKIYTLDELIKKLPAKLISSSIIQNTQEQEPPADITIAIGNDLTGIYKFEEDSIEDFNKAQDSQENIDFSKQTK